MTKKEWLEAVVAKLCSLEQAEREDPYSMVICEDCRQVFYSKRQASICSTCKAGYPANSGGWWWPTASGGITKPLIVKQESTPREVNYAKAVARIIAKIKPGRVNDLVAALDDYVVRKEKRAVARAEEQAVPPKKPKLVFKPKPKPKPEIIVFVFGSSAFRDYDHLRRILDTAVVNVKFTCNVVFYLHEKHKDEPIYGMTRLYALQRGFSTITDLGDKKVHTYIVLRRPSDRVWDAWVARIKREGRRAIYHTVY